MSASENQIAVYQPNGTVRLDVRLENETVRLAQEQMIELFQRDRSVISRHIANAFKEGEVNRDSVYAKNAYAASEGKISVGYRVKSVQGARFRQWATGVPKEYLIRGYAVNTMFAQLEDKMDRRLAKHDDRLATSEQKVGFFVQAKDPPLRSTFYQNQFWDAKSLLIKFIRRAKKELIVIDAHPGVATLDMLAKRGRGLKMSLVVHIDFRKVA